MRTIASEREDEDEGGYIKEWHYLETFYLGTLSVDCGSVNQVSITPEQNLFNGNETLNVTVFMAAVIFFFVVVFVRKL